MVGYNVQAAVDAQHHLIVAHEVTNQGHDRSQLANMTAQAQAATGTKDLRVLAGRGYFSGEEILACEQTGATPFVPKPLSSGAKAEEKLSKNGFFYTCRGECLPLPRRPDVALAHDNHRERDAAAPLLGFGELPGLRDQRAVHAQPQPARRSMAARGHHQRHAAEAEP